MKKIPSIVIALCAGLPCLTLAQSKIEDLPDSGQVVLFGTVEDVNDEKEFTLRDDTGTIDVEVKSGQSLILRKGTPVKVYGYIDSGIFSKDIDATRVELESDNPKEEERLGTLMPQL